MYRIPALSISTLCLSFLPRDSFAVVVFFRLFGYMGCYYKNLLIENLRPIAYFSREMLHRSEYYLIFLNIPGRHARLHFSGKNCHTANIA